MNSAPEQRWGGVPSAEATAGWPVRGVLTRFAPGDRRRLARQFELQRDAVLDAWLVARNAAYLARHGLTEVGPEAEVDLLCWQRREKVPAVALRWLKEFEEAAAEGFRA